MFKTATICAFNPMVDDFKNARFFFGDSFKRSALGPADVLEREQQARLALQHKQQVQQREEQQEAMRQREENQTHASSLPAWAQNRLKAKGAGGTGAGDQKPPGSGGLSLPGPSRSSTATRSPPGPSTSPRHDTRAQ
eukprot:gene3190-13205_t